MAAAEAACGGGGGGGRGGGGRGGGLATCAGPAAAAAAAAAAVVAVAEAASEGGLPWRRRRRRRRRTRRRPRRCPLSRGPSRSSRATARGAARARCGVAALGRLGGGVLAQPQRAASVPISPPPSPGSRPHGRRAAGHGRPGCRAVTRFWPGSRATAASPRRRGRRRCVLAGPGRAAPGPRGTAGHAARFAAPGPPYFPIPPAPSRSESIRVDPSRSK